MKKILFFVTFAFLSASKADVTKIEFEYADIFDEVCAKNSKIEIKLETKAAAYVSTPTFQKFWDSEGPTLLKTLFNIVGKEFYRKELTAYTSVCNFKPMSAPFLLRIGKWINKTDDGTKIAFVQITFHEFIHKYIVAHWDYSTSKLLYKYKDEDGGVISHMHLMALEKAVYLELGRHDFLKLAEDTYINVIGGAYKRSWEIVNHDDDYKLFLAEVQKSLKNKEFGK